MRSVVRAGLLLAIFGASACRPASVDLRLRPEPGAIAFYTTTVEVASVSRLEGEPAEREIERVSFRSRHTVLDDHGNLDGDGDGVRVEVVVAVNDADPRRFEVRFDRAAQLQGIDQVDGDAAPLVGELGLSELFPGAAGALPDRRLGPGERFALDDTIELPGIDEEVRLTGRGRLVELGVEEGIDVAVVESSSALDLPALDLAPARTTLDGAQTGSSTVVDDVADVRVRRADATTEQRFAVTLRAPPGSDQEPVQGTLELTIRSQTRRTG
ncbi:hypothetical protein BH24ACT3_BH24ACT3_12450 [soil metagenome]